MLLFDQDFKELARLRKARNQPCLPMTGFELHTELEMVRSRYFPQLTQRLSCFYVDHGALACIALDMETGLAEIFVHQILNHPDTPRAVATFICKHELLHLVVRPREIDGRQISHPPEFWEHEARFAPEKDLVWGWIYINFYECLRENRDKERITVTSRWKRLWGKPRTSISSIERSFQGHRSPA